MIADPLLRWVVTALFVISTAISLGAMATGRVSGPRWVSELLHVAMSVAMAVMAWPWGLAVPNAPAMVFFLAATGWFLLRAVIGKGAMCGGPVAWYHAAMMGAMAWMYAVMGALVPGQGGGHAPEHGHGGHGHGGGGHGHQADPAWITAVNGFWTVFFAIAALLLTYRYFEGRRHRRTVPAELSADDAGVIGQAMMAAGMAIMFGVML